MGCAGRCENAGLIFLFVKLAAGCWLLALRGRCLFWFGASDRAKQSWSYGVAK